MKRIIVFILPCFISLLIFSNLTFGQQGFIQLAWRPNVEPDLSHYIMYRDTLPGTMVYLESIPSTDTMFTDITAVCCFTYYYKLTAVDFSGNESGPSNQAIASVGILTSVNNDGENAINDFELKQNYPNPFNPTTTIEYSVPQQSRVSITIYNIAGQEIRNLINEFKEPGNYKVEWDGKDDNGRVVSSGVYFYQMIAKDFREGKKTIFQK